jgi:hypothetical protein
MRPRRLQSSQSTLKNRERRDIMAFTFEVEFNQNGELLSVTPEGKSRVGFNKFHDEYEPIGAVIPGKPLSIQTIPIDLKLLVLKGDDPCITHKGRRY